MKNKLTLLFVIQAVLCLFLLCGCARSGIPPEPSMVTAPTEPIPSPAPATEPGIHFEITTKSFAERYGDYYDSKRSFSTTLNEVTYHFDVSIKEDERLEIIEICENFLAVLLQDFPDYTRDVTLCFRPGDYPARFLDHTLYIGLDHLQTQSFAIGVAGAVFGENVNYGLLYGIGTRTGEKIGYWDPVSPMAAEEALTLCEDAPEYLDLNYPCFLSRYTGEEIMPKVTSLSLHFYDYLASRSRWDLFTDYSDSAYCTLLNEYLAAHGKEPYDNSDLQNTVFYFGGPLVRLVWETDDAVFYLEEAFETQYEAPHLADRMNSDYPTLRGTIVDYSLQIDYMEERLGQFESDSAEKVDVLFAAGHATDRYSMANYSYSENLIRMFCAEPFLHEYGHYLLRETGIESWTNELICYYYGFLPVNEHISYMWSSEVARMEATTGVEREFIVSLKDKLGHIMEWRNPSDFAYILSGYLALYENYGALTDPDAGAEAKVSFMHYLTGIYGEEAVIAAIVNADPAETLGKDWPELIADWTETVQEEYNWIHDIYYINGG